MKMVREENLARQNSVDQSHKTKLPIEKWMSLCALLYPLVSYYFVGLFVGLLYKE